MRMLINSNDEEAKAKCLEDPFSQSVAQMPKVIRYIAKLLKIALIEPSKFLSAGNSLLTFFFLQMRKPPKFWHIGRNGDLVLMNLSNPPLR